MAVSKNTAEMIVSRVELLLWYLIMLSLLLPLHLHPWCYVCR